MDPNRNKIIWDETYGLWIVPHFITKSGYRNRAQLIQEINESATLLNFEYTREHERFKTIVDLNETIDVLKETIKQQQILIAKLEKTSKN